MATKAEQRQTPQSVKIDKIYFLIHPTCWEHQVHAGDADRFRGYLEDYIKNGGNASNWFTALNWERSVNRKQKELISRLKPNEAMIIYPIGDSPPMLGLIEHAERCLGNRCVVLKQTTVIEPKVMHEMDEPIRHFLEDEEMEGRDAHIEAYPPDIRQQALAEIRQACEVNGYGWNPGGLKVVLGNRVWAKEIADEFAARNLTYDPQTVEAEAFGEGFEQCAMTWKALIPGYLGWTNPIENDFNLSVTGAQVLFDAELKDRIDLGDGVRLFMWERSHGIPVGLYQQPAPRFADRQLYAHVPLDGVFLEAWSLSKKAWPGDDSPLETHNGCLKVPVFTALRRGNEDSYYLLGANMTCDAFRDLLSTATIGTGDGQSVSS